MIYLINPQDVVINGCTLQSVLPSKVLPDVRR